MRERLALVIASIIALGVVGGSFLLIGARDPGDPATQARDVLAAYARAWENEAWTAMEAFVSAPPDDFAAQHRGLWEHLDVVEAKVSLGEITVNRGQATSELDVALTLRGLGEYDYTVPISALQEVDEWRVSWARTSLHPDLERDTWRLERRERPRDRAPILARDGTPLTVAGTIHVVGIEPRRVEDAEAIVAAFEENTDADPDDVADLLARDDLVDDWFYPVMTVRPGPYEAIREALFPIPGIVFRETEARLTQTEDFASHVLGRTGEITAELLEELGPPYAVGDEVGLAGLERVFERQLAGSTTADIVVMDGFDEVRRVLAEFDGDAPVPVRTTLDIAVQQGAEEALAEIDGAAAIVAVDAPTGAILAVASRPLWDFNRALTGLYPPGSTFKIVTAAALVEDGARVTDAVDCPAETVVGGLRVTNAGGLDLGNTTLLNAFARSCNTSFARLAGDLDDGVLADMADAFGFDVAYDLPLDVAGGRFPDPADLAEVAAAAFGQARVQASPLHLATVAAAARSGRWQTPHLLQDEDFVPVDRRLDERVVEALGELMRAVVTDGTGTAAGASGSTVHGKTGSAETGSGPDDPVHAWFVGYEGDLAFAVLVEGGGSGGDVAAPLARDFLDAVAAARADVDA